MSARQLCEQLMQNVESPQRELLLGKAAASPDSVPLLLEQARSAAQTTPEEALRCAGLAAEIAGLRGEPRDAAAAYRIQAQALRVLGRHADALPAFDSAAACAGQAGDALLVAQVQIGKIDSLGMLGHYEEAVALAHRLEEELRAEGAEEDAGRVLFNVGSLHFRRDRYAEALDCYRRAGEILERTGDPTVAARIQSNCANVLTHLNRIEEAVSLYEGARAVFAERGMMADAAVVDTNMGYLHYVSGRHAAALACLTRAHREFVERGRDLEAARCDIDTADAYRALNLYPEALECAARAIKTLGSLAVDYDRARAELNCATVLMAMRRTDEARLALERAAGIFRMQRNTLQQAHVRLIRAGLLRLEGRLDEACEEAGSAARTLARSGLPGWAAEARFVPAEVALEKDVDAARQMRAVSRVAKKHARGWLECRAERALGRYYARREDTQRALHHFRKGVAALEDARTLIAPEEMHVAFLHDKSVLYEDLVATLLARGRSTDIVEALEYVERSKSRLLLERVQAAWEGRRVVGGGAAQARERLAALRAELSRGYHQAQSLGESDPRRLVGTGTESMDALTALEHAYRLALREIELADIGSDPTVFALTSVVSVEALQTALQLDETLVEFYIVRGSICAFVVGPGGVRIRQGIADLEEVSRAARRLRYHLQKTGVGGDYATLFRKQLHAAIEEVLERLYGLLLRPLEPLMTGKVVLIPHGILHGLPFHAFLNGRQYAVDDWEFVYAPSAAVWHAGRRREGRKGSLPSSPPPFLPSLLMAVPGPGIERVASEVEQLARFLPESRVYCAEHATIEAFRAHAGRSRILHLATHALFREDNPLFSGLRFADGWLLARDLYDMTLPCDLATLSACQTGVTFVEPGDELFGLLRGFLAAGVRSVAASLWPADDVATADLMARFYALLAQGTPKAAALRAAQQETRARYPHPYYWAAFALVGER